MVSETKHSKEIFSFHIVTLPILKVPRFLFFPPSKQRIPGLFHAEHLYTMNLGESIISPQRYNLKTVTMFAWWREEGSLNDYLETPSGEFLKSGWQVRMKLYRRWGEITEIKDAFVDPNVADPKNPVVAVTLARLKISQTLRFIKWGKPVESQVRDHKGQKLALAAMRPMNTFSTFSIWQNETDMLKMVRGSEDVQVRESHKLAMAERERKDFHYEFTTLRFMPFKEMGTWKGISNYLSR